MAGPSGHAKLSPSAAHRWLTCPASVAACANVVSPDNEHSLRGTAGHWVFAEWLLKGEPPAVGAAAPNGIVITQDLIDAAGAGVGWVLGYLKDHPKHSLLVEEQIEIGPAFGLSEGIFWGTSDAVVLTADGELVVFDLKLGYVDVQAEENEQLLSYCAGVIHKLGVLFDRVRLVIVQPANGGTKEWTLSTQDLVRRLLDMRPKVTAALAPDAPYVPTEEGCRYCAAAGICKALQGQALELARQEFATPAALLQHITVEELSLLLQRADLIDTALKAAREHAKKLLACGVEVPGFKRVEGRKNRVWKPGVEAQVKSLFTSLGLAEDAYAPRSLVSPAQAEKLAKGYSKAGDLEDLIEKPKGEPVLAPASDKRPALQPDFQGLDAATQQLLA